VTPSGGAAATPLLRVEGLCKAFGELRAVDGVSLDVYPGRLTCIIGPNGAGKTTLVNLLSGRLAPDAGRILFGGREITRLPAHARVRAGLSRSFQINSVFPHLSVADNLAIPVLARLGHSAAMLRRVQAVPGLREEVRRLLAEWHLADRRDLPAAALSHGSQRLLEIGIAMATGPRLLILDEPTAGLSPAEKPHVLAQLRRAAASGATTFVLVEHDMDIVFSLADRIVVMHRGRILTDGPPETIRRDPQVRDVYLGTQPARGAAGPAAPARPGGAPPEPLLAVTRLNTFYGQSHVVQDLSLVVRAGEVVALLGRNGAGKTTTLRSLMGFTPPRSGDVRLGRTRLAGRPPHEIAGAGVGYVPEDRRIFRDLTVRDNLLIARRALPGEPRGPGRMWDLQTVSTLFPDLVALGHLRGDQLSGGQQKMLAIGRALMGNPDLLLLDEPSEGLAPAVVRALAEAILRIRAEGIAILLAEQNASFAALVADRVYVIENGRIQLEEQGEAVRAHPELLQRYLAVEGAAARGPS
jgi:branched-chain amino acid transport system ATP-binding protein